MLESYEFAPGVYVLPSSFSVGPIGILPINAYLVKGEAPYLVDTGMITDRDAFTEAVEALVDPEDLQAIVLTHTDPDHIGALHRLLAVAPQAIVVTHFLSSAKLDVMGRGLPVDRLHLLNPGDKLELPGIRLVAAKPATFDAPETIALYDKDRNLLFSSDSFGAPLPRMMALANDIPPKDLASQQLVWASVDAPWVHHIEREFFAGVLDQVVHANPEWILSSHLPPARRMTQTLCANLGKAPEATPFKGPTQAEFEAMIAAAAATVPVSAEHHPS